MQRTAGTVIVGLALSGLTCVGAAPAVAAGSSTISLGSHLAKVHTSSGQTLKMLITASKGTSNGATVGVVLATHSPYNKGETHSWLFQVASNDFTYKSSSGAGTVNASLGKYGTVSLSFAKTGQSTSKCEVSGTRTIVKGKLHGAVHFDTNTNAWGKVDNKNLTFDTPNVVTVANSCNDGETPGGTPTCFTATTWSAPPVIGGNSSFVSGFSRKAGSKTITTITGTRTVQLSKPAGASRTDTLVAAAPAPTASGNTLTVKTSSSGPVSGSAKIKGGSPQSTPGYACTINGNKKTEHSKSYYASDGWSSATGIKFNFKASADLVSAKNGASGWAQNSYS